MGDWVDLTYPLEYEAVRTSDLMPLQCRRSTARPASRHGRTPRAASLGLLSRLQQNWAPGTGLVPDFAVDTPAQPRPAASRLRRRAPRRPVRLQRLPRAMAGRGRLSARRQRQGARGHHAHAHLAADGVRRRHLPHLRRLLPERHATVSWNYVCFTGAFGVGAMVDARYQELAQRHLGRCRDHHRRRSHATITAPPCAWSICWPCPAICGGREPDGPAHRLGSHRRASRPALHDGGTDAEPCRGRQIPVTLDGAIALRIEFLRITLIAGIVLLHTPPTWLLEALPPAALHWPGVIKLFLRLRSASRRPAGAEPDFRLSPVPATLLGPTRSWFTASSARWSFRS